MNIDSNWFTFLDEYRAILFSKTCPSDITEFLMENDRPYLSNRERQLILSRMTVEEMREFLSHGECFHFPFNETEISVLLNQKKRWIQEDRDPLELAENSTSLLLGRSIESIQAFFDDVDQETTKTHNGDQYLFFEDPSNDQHSTLNHRSKSVEDILGSNLGFKQHGNINVASGAINHVKFIMSNQRNVLLSAACTNSTEAYNRPGELVSYDIQDGLVRIIDGHHHICFPTLRMTVSDIKINTSFVFTAGYDNAIKIWSQDDMSHRNTWSKHKDKINMIARHSSDLILASASNDGSVILWPYDFDKSYTSKGSILFKRTVKGECNYADTVYFCGYKHKDLLLTSTGAEVANSKKGLVEIYDGPHMKRIGVIDDVPIGISCLGNSTDGSEIGVGGGKYHENSSGDGFLRIYNVNQIRDKPLGSFQSVRNKPIMKLETHHYDTDSISFSPDDCSLFIATSDAHSHQVSIFDRRFTAKPLNQFSHAPQGYHIEDSEGMVPMVWYSDSILITGGADGIVNIWNLSLGDQLLARYQDHDGSVNSIDLSHDKLSFGVGLETGRVVVYSMDQSLLHGSFLLASDVQSF